MVTVIEEFLSKAGALEYRTNALKEYPPRVFGTRATVRLQKSGFWECITTRFR